MSEQPVAVCPECGGTTEKPQCIVSHAPYQHTQLMYHEPNQHDCTVCSNLFHSNTEQGSRYDKCKVCGDERQFIDGKWHHLKGDGPCVEPTAQAVAGEPKRCKTCACKLCEDCESNGQCCGCEDMKVIDDLRRQLKSACEQLATQHDLKHAAEEKIRHAEKEILIKEIEENTKTKEQLSERDAVIEKVREIESDFGDPGMTQAEKLNAIAEIVKTSRMSENGARRSYATFAEPIPDQLRSDAVADWGTFTTTKIHRSEQCAPPPPSVRIPRLRRRRKRERRKG